MFLTGYHGTSMKSANKIINEKRFDLSNSGTEWLGPGIYFYFNFSDAYNWRNAEAIMHSVIEVDEDAYLDIDSIEGRKVLRGIVNHIAAKQNKNVVLTDSYIKNQCAVMKVVWDKCPEIKAMAASFHTERTKIKMLLDVRPERREFCIRDNDCIRHTYLIKRSDVCD